MKMLFLATLIIVGCIVAGLLLWRWSDDQADRRIGATLAATQPESPAQFDPKMVADLPEPARRYFSFTIKPGTPLYTVADALREGQLVPMLHKYQLLPESAIYLAYLPNRTLPSRVRVLIDFLTERFGPVPSWEVDW